MLVRNDQNVEDFFLKFSIMLYVNVRPFNVSITVAVFNLTLGSKKGFVRDYYQVYIIKLEYFNVKLSRRAL